MRKLQGAEGGASEDLQGRDLGTRGVSHGDGEGRGSQGRARLGKKASGAGAGTGNGPLPPLHEGGRRGGRKEMGTQSSLYKESFLFRAKAATTSTSNTNLPSSPQLPHVQPLLTSHLLIRLPSTPFHPTPQALENSSLTDETPLRISFL